MSRDLEITKYQDDKNALSHRPHPTHILRTNLNMLLVSIGRRLPFQLKNRFFEWAGTELGENVYICYGVWIDGNHPEKVSIGDNTTVGGGTRILAHEATQNEYRTGKVKIGKNVLIGTDTLILPGVEIGDNAKIAAKSLVNRDVKEGEFVGGVPIETIEE